MLRSVEWWKYIARLILVVVNTIRLLDRILFTIYWIAYLLDTLGEFDEISLRIYFPTKISLPENSYLTISAQIVARGNKNIIVGSIASSIRSESNRVIIFIY